VHTRHRSTRLVVALAATSLVTLAACGSDSDGAATTDAPASSAPADTPVPATEAPATEAPATEVPATEAPAATEVPATEAPAATEVPATDAADTTPSTEAPAGNLIEVATAAGTFTTLLAAIEAAGLTDTIATGKYTVLAPTDEAFAALGQPAIDALLADPAQLTAVLQNHVLPIAQDLHSITIFDSIVTLGGGSLPVTVDGDAVTIGGANVVQADVAATNGYIDVIDTVLLPA
jgi:uncharacterized surface protein with fasciclin (FAS1) repeats